MATSEVPSANVSRAAAATATVPLQLTTLMPADSSRYDRDPRCGRSPAGYGHRSPITDQQAWRRSRRVPGQAASYSAQLAHLVEIDLLRRGRRVPMREALPPAAYFVFLSRVEHRPRTDVWPIALNQPLPQVPIPLQAPDADVTLDLVTAPASVYERLGWIWRLTTHNRRKSRSAPRSKNWPSRTWPHADADFRQQGRHREARSKGYRSEASCGGVPPVLKVFF